jgi:tRNA uridine 5-carbamoylmethylation protein Kti12
MTKMNKPYYIMLTGLPGSGKTTLAHQLIRLNCGFVYLSTDFIIERRAISFETTYNDVFVQTIDEATRLVNDIFIEAIGNRQSIIHDQTNLGRKKRTDWLSKVSDKYDRICIPCWVDPVTRQQRLDTRVGKTVPPHVMKSMEESQTFPTLMEGWDMIVSPVMMTKLMEKL